jgi:hypothetical protein
MSAVTPSLVSTTDFAKRHQCQSYIRDSPVPLNRSGGQVQLRINILFPLFASHIAVKERQRQRAEVANIVPNPRASVALGYGQQMRDLALNDAFGG